MTRHDPPREEHNFSSMWLQGRGSAAAVELQLRGRTRLSLQQVVDTHQSPSLARPAHALAEREDGGPVQRERRACSWFFPCAHWGGEHGNSKVPAPLSFQHLVNAPMDSRPCLGDPPISGGVGVADVEDSTTQSAAQGSRRQADRQQVRARSSLP